MIRCQRPLGPAILATLLCYATSGCQPNAGAPGTTTAGGTKATPAPGTPNGQPTKGAKKPARKPRAAASREGDLTYPRDKDLLMAVVNGRNVTLEDIVTHIDTRHYPGFRHLVSEKFGQLELRIPRMADWVRQYADILALRAETRRLGIKEAVIKQNLGQAFLEAFEKYRADYEERGGRPFPTSKKGKKALEDRFLKSRGLGLEVVALLNSLVPDEPMTRPEINAFYTKYSDSMNGLLKASQIFIKNRDKKTGALLRGEEMTAAKQRVAKIQELLAKDGSNFETIAAGYSENKASAKQKGLLDNLHRFDPRVPASICGAAWGLRNGQWTGPLQSRYGLHFVKRIDWTITKMIVNPDPNYPAIRAFVRSHRQETLLFDIRKKAKIELHY